jgi:uncharacterized protein (TIGR03067 family)
MENHMAKNLPARPDLDQLRRQAKSLLADLRTGDAQAIATLQEHLPAARGMTADELRAANLCLADAQSAIARKSGHASWPHLARHVEQLRALEGTWEFAQLEVDDNTYPPTAVSTSRILIDGDRFRTESPEATYEGIFNINVEAEPHEIDIEFVAGPEAGNWNYGIFRFEGEQLEICLDMNGKPRPVEFRSAAGSGQAYEILKRTSNSRPAGVTGGSPAGQTTSAACEDASAFGFVPSETLAKLEGEWTPTQIIRDGQELPKMMLRTGRRTANKNEVKISFGGQTMIHALVRLDESEDPVHVDYYNIGGGTKDTIQLGVFRWEGNEACFCMAAPGAGRPTDFSCTSVSGRTYSRWVRKS